MNPQPTTPPPHPTRKPSLIKVAIEAVGGRSAAAALLGVSPWSITNWQRTGYVPPEYIRRLCEAGGVIAVEQLLRFIEEQAAVDEGEVE